MHPQVILSVLLDLFGDFSFPFLEASGYVTVHLPGALRASVFLFLCTGPLRFHRSLSLGFFFFFFWKTWTIGAHPLMYFNAAQSF